MALALTSDSSHLVANPTASLTEALQSFDKILSEEQRQHYRDNFTTPDASSVIAFVSKVDADNKGRAGKCVAPRLCTFLEAIQQFSDVVGTFVSSNPTIAALVWGGVQTAILTASNVASYFDKITSLIMTIGRSCPTYKQFGLLYPDSVDLQKALCEYFSIVIRLCIKIIEVSQRSGFMQVVSPIFNPFEAAFKSYQDTLDQAAKDVQMQVSLASKKVAYYDAQLSELERKENSSHRRKFSLFQSEVRGEQAKAHDWRMQAAFRNATKWRAAIKANLSPMDHIKPWKRAMQQRVDGTATWIQHDANFCKWLQDEKTSILWCSGNLGTGKTVLVSSIVAYLHTIRRPSDNISFFFCQYEQGGSLLARNIFGSITCQLLNSHIEQANNAHLQNLYEESRNLDTEDVVTFLASKLEHNSSNFVILDGLDECELAEVERISKVINALYKSRSRGLKIFCSGRSDIERRLFHSSEPEYRISLARKEVDLDIERYIKATLEQRLADQVLKLGDPTLIFRIIDVLQEGARGMFLWTCLLIEEICAQNNDYDIIEALESLPSELSDLFRRIVQRVIGRNHADRAIKVLQFCSVAKRPLTVQELREAITVEPGQKLLNTRSLSNDMDRVLADCCGFLFVDDEEQTVHFIHHSVRKHLFAGDPSLRESTFNEAYLDRQLGLVCITYLNFNDLKRQLVKVKSTAETTIDPIHIGMTSLSLRGSLSNKVAQHLIHRKHLRRPITARDLERQLQEALGTTEASLLESELKTRQFQFLSYARTYWIFHLNNLDDGDKRLWTLFCNCVKSSDIMADRPWKALDEPGTSKLKWAHSAPTEIEWIIENNHSALLLYNESSTCNAISKEVRGNILIHSSAHGRTRFVSILLDNTENQNEELCQALQAAAGGGHLDVVERLLAAKADVNAAATAGHGGRTALQAAIAGGHLSVVERLLVANADVNAAAGNDEGRTALQAAAEGGHLDVVERLLVANADVNAAAAADDGRTALQAAAEGGHLDVVKRLLAANADVNATTTYDGWTALQAAAGGGHLDAVEMLLAAKADVNVAAAGHRGRTALQAAAGGGYIDVVERLLVAKADVNAVAVRHGGRTAVQAAAEGGYLDVVERLLAAKADVNAAATDDDGRTALQAAAEGGHLDVVERLLTAKAVVNAAVAIYGGPTALQAAAAGGYLDVVERLKKAGAVS